jgi:diguanylate cyclase (GGDEF)-like protein
MGICPERLSDRADSSVLRAGAGIAAVATVPWLALVAGFAVASEIAATSTQVVFVASFAVALVATLQFLALWLTGRAHRIARVREEELASTNDQLWLVNRLCASVERESCRRSVMGRTIEFFFEEMGVQGVVFWGTNSYGAPETPDLARRLTAPAGIDVPDSLRAVLARNAARDGAAVVVDGATGPHSLDTAHPPQGPFLLFVPLPGDDVCEGVLELQGAASSWRRGRWEVLSVLAEHIGAGLQRGRAFEQLQERAEEDYVTGLYNHGFMQSYLEKAIRESGESGDPLALLFLDVNNFKAFNDNLGHGAGDRVLQTVADELRLMSEGVGAVGRSGGDEFMVILPGHGAEEADAFTQAFQDWLAVTAPAVNGIYRIRVACGYAVYPEDARTRHELLAAADARLYKNKGQHSATSGYHSRAEMASGMGVYGLLDRIVESVHSKDAYSRAHSEKTAEYALQLARCLDLSPTAMRTLRLAALLHDVGKIGVPDSVLRKPGPLSDVEYEVVKHQVNIAEQLIVDIPNAHEVRSLVLLHHERWDGKGYPRGLAGEQIPYLARLLTVADAFSAMTLDRPYRQGLAVGDALKEIRRAAGTQFDPELVELFCEAITMAAPDGVPLDYAPSPVL